MRKSTSRRLFLSSSTVIGTGLLLAGCANEKDRAESSEKKDKQEPEVEVTATEDLMREHGILRRALLVFTAAASRLRKNPGDVPPEVLQRTSKLFRTFGQDYHEKRLEEDFIFPAVKKAGGEAADLADTLLTQHQRGREIIDYVSSLSTGQFTSANASNVAQVLEGFILMYQHHAAREDTVVFPAWKKTLSAAQLDEMGEKFEDIEHQQFGKDGFDDALTEISTIEGLIQLSDLSRFTPPAPPTK
jgi:hemerythrin-like domain-containing protein